MLLFHLPLTIYATFQLSLAASTASRSSVILAGFSLAIFSFLVPLALMIKVYRTPTRMLQEDMGTLLAYGPLYSAFSDRSYSYMAVRFIYSLIIGIVVGAAQNSGTVQAVILLVLEIADTLVTVRSLLSLGHAFMTPAQSLWLPWGDGAAMGPLSFIISVARIITAVLLIVLSPAVNVGISAAGWIAYVILVIQAVVGALLFNILLVKVVELIVRILGGVPFDESNRARSGGLSGALRRWDRQGKKNMRQQSRTVSSRRASTGLEGGSSQHMLGSSRPTSMHTNSQYGDMMASYRSQASPGPGALTEDLDDGYIMSAMSSGPWQGKARGGDYIAPTDYRTRSPSWGEQTPAGSSFAVVRGGKATDQSPYTLASQPSRGATAPPIDYFQGGSSVPPRARARSFSAQIEFAGEPVASSSALPQGARPARPPSVNLLSNQPPSSPGAEAALANPANTSPSKAAKRQSGASTLAPFFGFFRRNSSNEHVHEDTSDDDDDEEEDEEADEDRGKASTTRWPFGIRGGRRRPTTPEAAAGLDGEEAEAPAKSFVVVRPNKPAPKLPPPVPDADRTTTL